MQKSCESLTDHIKFLTPDENASQCEIYTKLLEHAIKEKSAKNIALAGPYGSGKSSILKYLTKKLAQKKKIVEISLANFEDLGEDLKKKKAKEKETGSAKEAIQTRVEKSLLQQLFFSVDKNEIPHSKLKRIVEYPRWKLALLVFAIISWIVTGFLLTNPDICELHLPIANRAMILTLTFLSLSAILLYLLFSYLSKVKLNKLVIQNNEFDLSPEDGETSLINRHIDEIVYFFEKTEYEILIIEDLDRFSCKEIFEKLRELNTIINNTESIRKRGKVTFIYAIKDDFFIDENRTKFFDQIIPVIPFVNATGNAKQLLLKMLRDAGHKEAIDEDLLRYISYQVHDHRLLLNIFNEYMIYFCQLSPDSQRKEDGDKSTPESTDRFATKLMAVIFYKNLFPGDFSALHRSEGVLYSLLSEGPQKLAEKKIEQLEKRISENRKRVEELENETAESLAELRMLCLKKLLRQYPGTAYIKIDSDIRGLIPLADNEQLFLSLLEKLQNPHNQISLQMNGRWQNIQKKDIKGFDTIAAEHKERMDRFCEKKEAEIEKHQKAIERLEAEKIEIRKAFLCELIEKMDGRRIAEQLLDECIGEKEAKWRKGTIQKQTILFLVQNGFIDENYQSTISYFHEGGDLSRADNEYIRDVMNQKEPQLGRKIDNPKAVVRELSPKLLATRYALNETVVCTLFTDRSKSDDAKRAAVVKLLAEEEESAKKFLPDFIKTAPAECATRLIGALAKEDGGFWGKALSLGFGDETTLALLLKGAKEEALLAQGEPLGRSLSELQTLPQLMNRYSLDRKKIETLLQQLDVKFTDLQILSADEENRKFLRFVYDHDLYALDIRMIALMVRNLGTFEKENRPSEKRAFEYGVIKESGLRELVERIDEHIDEYVEDYLRHLPSGKRFHDKRSLLLLLNHQHISRKRTEMIVSDMDTLIEHLTELERCDTMQTVVFQVKFSPTWKNVLHYFAQCADTRLDDALRSCFRDEEFVDTLLQQETPKVGQERDLFNTLVECMMFDNHFPLSSLNRFKGCFGPLVQITFEISATDPSRIKDLIDEKLLLTLPDVYRALRDYDEYARSDTRLHLLESDVALTLEILPEITIDKQEATRLLASSSLSLEEKAALVSPLLEHVAPEDIAASIGELLLEAIGKNLSLRLPVRAVCTALQSEPAYDKKRTIFEDQIQRVEEPGDAIALLKAMGDPLSRLISPEDEKRTVNISATKTNEAALEALKKLGIIGKFHRKKDRNAFTIYRKSRLLEA